MIGKKSLVEFRCFEVAADGVCRHMTNPKANLLSNFPSRSVYTFNLFIEDINRLVRLTSDDVERIEIAAILTKRFLSQADWIVDSCPPPDLEKRVSINKLHSEPDDSFHIATFSWLPQGSNVHSHGTWSIVAILGDFTTGRELNYFWSRQDDGSKPNYAVIKPISKQILEPGDIIGFTSDAIHNIKSLPPVNYSGESKSNSTLMFNIFGTSNLNKQYMFNPFDNTYINY